MSETGIPNNVSSRSFTLKPKICCFCGAGIVRQGILYNFDDKYICSRCKTKYSWSYRDNEWLIIIPEDSMLFDPTFNMTVSVTVR